MTLLIGSRSPLHVVITADGLSVRINGNIRTISGTNLQKIFPIPNNSVAIVHHGQNIIEDSAIGSLLVNIFTSNFSFFSSATPERIADWVQNNLEGKIKSTLTSIRDSKSCAFWICGFAKGINKPGIIELMWIKKQSNIELKRTEAGDLFIGGDGKDYILKYLNEQINGQFSSDKLWKAAENYHIRFHNKLWEIAEQRQAESGGNIFGGSMHRLIITPQLWKWETAPK